MEHQPNGEHQEDQLPFPPLAPSEIKGRSSEFYESPEHPDLLVRQSHGINVGTARYGKPDLSGLKTIVQGKEVFDDLVRRGVNVTPTLNVVGRVDTGEKDDLGEAIAKPMLYSISQKIEGIPLHEIPVLDAETIAKADETFMHTLEQVWDTYQHGGRFWSDFKIDQFVYGTTPGSREKEIYLVDTEPRSLAWGDDNDENKVFNRRQVKLFMFLSYMMDEVKDLEAKGQGNKLTKTRTLMTAIIRDMDTKPGMAKSTRDELLRDLDNERSVSVSPYDDVG